MRADAMHPPPCTRTAGGTASGTATGGNNQGKNQSGAGPVGGDGVAVAGLATVATLLSLEAYVVMKYIFMVNKLRTEGSFTLIGLTPQRLKRRLAYITNRYSSGAMYHWQFVIWLRLLVLTLTTTLPDLVSAVLRGRRGADRA